MKMLIAPNLMKIHHIRLLASCVNNLKSPIWVAQCVLGAYPCKLEPNTLASRVYGTSQVDERHRHRFEFNNEYRDIFQENGMSLSGLSPDGLLVEVTELADHPYMIGSQFHPEFLSRPTQAHPLFLGLVEAALEYQNTHTASQKADN